MALESAQTCCVVDTVEDLNSSDLHCVMGAMDLRGGIVTRKYVAISDWREWPLNQMDDGQLLGIDQLL